MGAFHCPPIGARDLGVGGREWDSQQRVVIFLIRVCAGAVRATPLETGFGIGGQSMNPRRVARLRMVSGTASWALAMATFTIVREPNRHAATGRTDPPHARRRRQRATIVMSIS